MRLTRTQAAERLYDAPKTLYSWDKSGRIPPPERDWRGWRWYTDAHLSAIAAQMGRKDVMDKEKGGGQNVSAPTQREVSARNRFAGTVVAITGDGILCEVVLRLPGAEGYEIVSVITRSSVERLGLKVGETAVALMKSTDVLLAR